MGKVAGTMADEKIRCERCRYWEELKHASTEGECHRYAPPPRLTELEKDKWILEWPGTDHDEWCGEFEPGKSRG